MIGTTIVNVEKSWNTTEELELDVGVERLEVEELDSTPENSVGEERDQLRDYKAVSGED